MVYVKTCSTPRPVNALVRPHYEYSSSAGTLALSGARPRKGLGSVTATSAVSTVRSVMLMYVYIKKKVFENIEII